MHDANLAAAAYVLTGWCLAAFWDGHKEDEALEIRICLWHPANTVRQNIQNLQHVRQLVLLVLVLILYKINSYSHDSAVQVMRNCTFMLKWDIKYVNTACLQYFIQQKKIYKPDLLISSWRRLPYLLVPLLLLSVWDHKMCLIVPVLQRNALIKYCE